MHRLFWKIFLLIWSVNASVFVLGYFLPPLLQNEDGRPHFPIEELAEAAVGAHANGTLEAFYAETRRKHRATVYLLTQNDRLLPSGYAVKSRIPHVTEYPSQSSHRFRSKVVHVRAMEIDNDAGVTFRFIVRMMPPKGGGAKGPQRYLLPILLIAIAVTSLLVAAYITQPLRKLQMFVRRFASGERKARVSEVIAARRDVVGELGHEFNIMAERLDATLESQRNLLRDISHELRTPLARMQVAVTLAEDNSSGAQPQLARLHTEIERLDKLIGQVLTLARLESGANTLHLQPVPVVSMLRDIAADAEFEYSAQGKSVTISCSAEIEEIQITADREQLTSASENIIRNAMRYTAENSSVDVRITRTGGSLTVSVRDSGPGVPEESLPKLFDAFFRADGARTESSNGTNGGHGVGLAITRGIILSHQGAIEASNHPTGGLEIVVSLPLHE